jgi:hypothetical protein
MENGNDVLTFLHIFQIQRHSKRVEEVKNLNNQANGNELNRSNSLSSRQGSGSEYHRKHAGHIEGYGELHPTTADMMSNTENTIQ